MENLSQPKNTTADVLYSLIRNKKVSLQDFPRLAGFRTRLSNIKVKHQLPLIFITKEGINKFGNKMVFREHILEENQVEKAISIYNQINI